MRILVIDGQGGHLGRELVTAIKEQVEGARILAVGTNATATSTMLRAGADSAATGENPVIVGARKADYIIGPLGIVIADSLVGEVTPAMALAVGQSDAKRILIPMNMCDNMVAGLDRQPVVELVQDAVAKLKASCCE